MRKKINFKIKSKNFSLAIICKISEVNHLLKCLSNACAQPDRNVALVKPLFGGYRFGSCILKMNLKTTEI